MIDVTREEREHMGGTAIEVADLRKSYGDVEAVKGISFEVAEGECVAMLGPNGAGKTTTVEVLEGFRSKSSGAVRVLGMDPETAGRDFRERIGIVLQSSGLDRNLTVKEIVYFYGGYYPRPRGVDEVVDLVGLTDKADTRVKALSGGQRRRLDLALGIVGDPDLIFLDEPITGFDPSARRRSWELVDNLRSLGKTILLTTHYMDEAQNLADRVVVLSGGAIVAEGTPESLGGRDVAEAVISFRLPVELSLADLPSGLPATPQLQENHVMLRTTSPTAALNLLTGWAVGRGEELEALTVTRPSLEDIYLQLTGDTHPAFVHHARKEPAQEVING
jgi:ABC-2 type transport system ATP-binding protein